MGLAMTFFDFFLGSFGLLCLFHILIMLISVVFHDAEDFRDACKPFMAGFRLLFPALFLVSLVVIFVD